MYSIKYLANKNTKCAYRTVIEAHTPQEAVDIMRKRLPACVVIEVHEMRNKIGEWE